MQSMDTLSFKTRSARVQDIVRTWYVVDARHQVVGRLASTVAAILRGKHKPAYTPHVDTGDYVIVINAECVRFTGNKENGKRYYRYSGYPGGLRSLTVHEMRQRRAEHLVRHAVKGMMPKGPLGRQMLKKLKVYVGSEHPHQAQRPQLLAL